MNGEFQPPEGGWGWIVCLAFTWTNGIVSGILVCFGVFFIQILTEIEDVNITESLLPEQSRSSLPVEASKKLNKRKWSSESGHQLERESTKPDINKKIQAASSATSLTPEVKPENKLRSSDPTEWCTVDVIQFVSEFDPSIAKFSNHFKKYEIDGKAFFLLKNEMMMKYMGLKLGPVVKHSSLVEKLREVKSETKPRSSDQTQWSTDDVIQFVSEFDPVLAKFKNHLKNYEINDKAFFLLKNEMMMKYMKLKLGPVVKLNNLVEKLQEVKSETRSSDPTLWSTDDVIQFVSEFDPALARFSDHFKKHEIDGKAFFLLNSEMMMKYMGLKLGPAVKLSNLVEKLNAKKL